MYGQTTRRALDKAPERRARATGLSHHRAGVIASIDSARPSKTPALPAGQWSYCRSGLTRAAGRSCSSSRSGALRSNCRRKSPPQTLKPLFVAPAFSFLPCPASCQPARARTQPWRLTPTTTLPPPHLPPDPPQRWATSSKRTRRRSTRTTCLTRRRSRSCPTPSGTRTVRTAVLLAWAPSAFSSMTLRPLELTISPSDDPHTSRPCHLGRADLPLRDRSHRHGQGARRTLCVRLGPRAITARR